ncbi:hypothetical protein Glove_103g172 [Diversispora epigaea]|uniref:Uncharacterized protein n=1 Tax=Diversispora epigaea TaxID=1348612 RepID=A0A397J448_9GLOM|nr:hypothetical protein Glove_103g172 [Diversispora epigaea]
MLICARSNCQKPVYVESDGYAHPYCGKTCESAAVAINTIRTCSYSFCHRSRYMDANGKFFDYCGRTCAIRSLEVEGGENQDQRLLCKNGVNNNNNNVSGEKNLCGVKCSRTDCSRERFVDPIEPTKFYSFCNRECYWTEINSLTTTKITLVSKMDFDYTRISDDFMKELPNIKIQGILRLQMPKKIGEAHLKLRKKKKIVYQMYHGTYANCDLKKLIKYKKPQCNLPISATGGSGSNLFGGGGGGMCGVCGIIREGNSTKYSNHNGKMWFASLPSISISYTSGEIKAIFCVDVVTGKTACNYEIIDSNAEMATQKIVWNDKFKRLWIQHVILYTTMIIKQLLKEKNIKRNGGKNSVEKQQGIKQLNT